MKVEEFNKLLDFCYGLVKSFEDRNKVKDKTYSHILFQILVTRIPFKDIEAETPKPPEQKEAGILDQITGFHK